MGYQELIELQQLQNLIIDCTNKNQEIFDQYKNDLSAKTIGGFIYERMINHQKSIPSDEDLAISCVHFGSDKLIIVSDIYCIGNTLIVFHGVDTDGTPVELIQHVSRLDFLLTSVKRQVLEVPQKTIGFQMK